MTFDFAGHSHKGDSAIELVERCMKVDGHIYPSLEAYMRASLATVRHVGYTVADPDPLTPETFCGALDFCGAAHFDIVAS